VTATPSTTVEVPALRQLVDGEVSEPSVDLGVDLENPNTGEVISRQVATADADVERAAAAAHAAYESGQWSTTPVEQRAAILEAVADALDAEAMRLAALESLGTGAIIRTTGMLAAVINGGAFRLAAGQLRAGVLSSTMDGPTGLPAEIHRLPWGPALSLVPWNAPAPMAAHKVANSLAAGAPSILKPSEWAPYGTQELGLVVGRVLAEHGQHPGVFQLVQGGPHVGGALVTDPRIRAISFTGGLNGGRAIAAACALDFKPAQLELGGNNPIVVLADADVDQASTGIVDLLTQLNGQWCRALGRLVLAEPVADAVLDAVLDKLAAIRLGDSVSPETDMGPIVHSAHLAHLRGRIAELQAKGGKAHATTPLPDLPGNFLAPTLVTGVSSADAQDEIFGPVATVHTVKDDAEAVQVANGTPFGLEGYVFAGDPGRGMAVARQIRAGGVKVNGSTMLSLNLFAPRPAWGLSGQGDEGTLETLLFFTNHRVVGVENLSAGDLSRLAAGG
jgi:acyl-CoA reductase-like NAD-dependent aldehyde dehydrogenase